ncbi:MAG: hypothetical protein ACP6KW_05855 [Candidatus Thorarchaeota archaeon]
MKTGLVTRKIAAAMLIAALFAPYFISFGIVPTKASADPTGGSATIVFDMGHGQYKDSVFTAQDTWLANNLTAMGFHVVFAWGGLNDTILADARGLVIGSIYGTSNGFTAAEVTAIGDWFDDGKKFLWVGADSDYGGNAYINDNASLILEEVGSHVYPEPISVSDAYSNCNASYRVVANGTSTDAFVADIVDGVDAVLMHGPTTLYGSTSATAGADAVALENTTITNVYPVLYYGASATIGDSDLVPPLAHNDGDVGAFVAMTVEVTAGDDVIIVSGASPYGDYMPMSADEYYDVPLSGNIVKQAISWGMSYAEPPIIVFDMGHGQYKDSVFTAQDAWLAGNLTQMGYYVVWAWGGLNDTVLGRATGLVIGSIYGSSNGFTAAEITAIGDWFDEGGKFLWVGTDSDYGGNAYINGNASLILEEVGSHVYPEPISVSDAYSNCNASYRVVANGTTTNTMFADIVDNVDAVLMHGPTTLYGSTSATAGADAVALENTTIADVYPLLYYGASATIGDSDLVPPLAHNDGDVGAFVAMTIELNAGSTEDSVIVVSGASPYGDYMPMSADEYYDVPLSGNIVKQTIDWSIDYLTATTTTTPTTTPGFTIDPVLLMGIAGVVVLVIIIAIVVKRR